MDPVALGVGFLAGLAAGAVVWRALRSRQSADLAAAREQAAADAARLDEARGQLGAAQQAVSDRERQVEERNVEIARLTGEIARLSAELNHERLGAIEKLAAFERAETSLREAFKSLSSSALHENAQAFLELARASLGEFQKHATLELDSRRQAIGELVTPLRESLQKVDATLHEVEKSRREAHGAIDQRLEAVATAGQQLQSETARLVRALRTPHVRGRWGEMQLRNVIELAGLEAQCDFIEQPSVMTEEGRRTPDLVVRLPGGKQIVVDAKTPLDAFLDAYESSDEDTRQVKLQEHARQVRDHLTKLGSKAYWEQFDASPQFVFMFVPSEAALSAALQQDHGLIEYGVARRVIPASPTTLIALMLSVAHGWQQERIAENAARISREGRELYDRIGILARHFDELRKALARAVAAYNAATGSLDTRVIVSARRLKELSVTTGDDPAEPAPVERHLRTFKSPELRDLLEEAGPVEGEVLERDDGEEPA